MRNTFVGLLLATIVTPLSQTSHATEIDFGFGIDITRSNLKLDAGTLGRGDFIEDDSDALGASGYGRMHIDNGFVAEAGFTHGSDLGGSLFGGIVDHYSYDGVFARAGFEWRVGKNFSVTPQLGLQHTRLYFEEGEFFNPGEEDEIRVTSTRPLVGLKLGVPLGQTFEMYYRVQYIDLTIGSLVQQSAGISFMF
jgi:hypothetical protein